MIHRSSLIVLALTLTIAAIVVAQSRPTAASGPSDDETASSQPASKPATPGEQSVANLRNIAMTLQLYQMEHKNKVPTMAQLAKEYDLDASVTTSPLTGQPYQLTGWPMSGPEGKQEHVVVFETGNDAGNLAICNDLSLVKLRPNQLKEIMAPAK